MDYVAEEINNYSQTIAHDVEKELNEAHQELVKLREELIELILETGEGSLDWDVQKGRYESSNVAMRDMFNDVTVHSINIDEFNEHDLTVEGLANSGLNVRGLAVMNRWLFDKSEPIYNDFLAH